MRKTLVLFCVSGIVTGSAAADPANLEGGAFLAHLPTGMEYSSGPPAGGWCQEYWDHYRIEDCEDQVNRIETTEPVIWFILAAWAEEKEWCGTEFGLGEYDPSTFSFTDHGPCWPEDGLEIPTASWPGPGEGTAIVTTGAHWEGNLVPVYYFAGYAYEEGLLPLAVDPATGFVGTSNCESPPQAWAADSLGGMGLFRAGVYACPEGLMAGGQGSGSTGGGGIEPEAGGGILGPGEHNVIFVCPGTADSTIQAAIDASTTVDGDTIELCCDVPFTGDLNRNISFLGKRLVIRSECDDPARCVIDCEGRLAGSAEARRGLVVGPSDSLGVTVRGVTVFDGVSYDSLG